MSTEDKNRNEILSRLAADLFVKTKGSEELSSKIQRLRDEIKKVIESDDTLFGKFRGLAESFRDIIPDEKQRFHAAIKALSTTAKVSRQDVEKAIGNQLEELKILEKSLLGTPSGWRNQLNAMEAKSREIRNEITKLQEKIGALESEERDILTTMATREKEMELVSKAVGELFTDISAEITHINKKIQELAAERVVSPPPPPRDTATSDVRREQKSETLGSPELHAPESQKKCPMCGGRMDFDIREKLWRCYSCAFEESTAEKETGKPASETPEPSAPQETKWQKKCPVCGGQMNFHFNEQMWICYSCAYEEPDEGEGREKSETKIDQPKTPALPRASDWFGDSAPSSSVSSDTPPSSDREVKEWSSPSKSPTKKKTCPVCRKKMDWYPDDKAWRCPFCEYERRI